MALSPSQAFGLAAREIRREQGLSQEQAALKAGIDRAFYGHIERATKSATLNTVWKVAEALSVPTATLFVRAEQLLAEQQR